MCQSEYAPRHIFRLPHERRRGVTDAVRDEHDRVRGDALGVAGSDARDPRQGQDETGRAHAGEPLPEEQPDLVLPGQKIDQEYPKDVREEVNRPDVSATVLVPRRERHSREDSGDLHNTVNAA